MTGPNPIYRTINKAIKKDLFPDPYFVAKYHFSPYMACEHACVYCDGRAEKYFVEGDYEKDIVVRKNLIEILARELPKKREPGIISIGSGISDVYQPIEKEENLMRRSAELLLQYDFGVTVLTKSSLVERDLDVWSELNQKKKFTLIMTLITNDDNIRASFEPNASSIEDRLETLRKFKQAGMSVGALAMPLLPFITDSAEHFQKLLFELQKIPVDFVLPGLLTLRPGRQKDFFMNHIAQSYQHFYSDYQKLYSRNLASGSPDFSYAKKKFTEIRTLISNAGLLLTLPLSSFRGQFSLYDEIYIFMCHLRELYWENKSDLSRLNYSIKKYEEFILPYKRKLNRTPSMSPKILEKMLIDIFMKNEMQTILKNEKLAHFLYEIFIEYKSFDERALRFKKNDE